MSARRASRPVSQMNPCKTTLLANVRLPNVSMKENTANENNTFEIQPTLVTDAKNITDFIRQTAAKQLKAGYPSHKKVLILGQDGLLTELQQDFKKNHFKTTKLIDMFFATPRTAPDDVFEPLNWFSQHMKLWGSKIEILNSEESGKKPFQIAQQRFQKLYDDYQSFKQHYEHLQDTFLTCQTAVTNHFSDKHLPIETKVNYYDFAGTGVLYSHTSLAQTQLKNLFIQLTKFQEQIIMLWRDMLYVRNHLEQKHWDGFDVVDTCTPPIKYDGVTTEDSYFIQFLIDYWSKQELGVEMYPLRHFLTNVDFKEANTKRVEFGEFAFRLMEDTKGIKHDWQFIQ